MILLTALKELGSVGRTVLVDTIAGVRTKASKGVSSSASFGTGSTINLAVWGQLLDGFLEQGLVDFVLSIRLNERDGLNHAKVTLKIGPAGEAFLSRPHPVQVKEKSLQKYDQHLSEPIPSSDSQTACLFSP